jgi:hypothetical protein
MVSFANGRCAHRWVNGGRCLELATATRPVQKDNVVYDIPLCEDHTEFFDKKPAKL